MKLADYVASFLAAQGIRHVFVITGGAAAHLIDSIAKNPDIDYICTQHEQAAAMAADAYARVNENLGAAIATSGPGATNLITGVCCAYYDSIPVLYITGQVATSRSHKGTGTRQLGFQEADTVDIFRPFTKYAALIDDPTRIKYELEKATHIAKSGRPGPVLIDLPDDLQRADIDPNALESFTPAVENKDRHRLNEQAERCIQLIKNAKRPVVILGWGIRLAKAEEEAKEFIDKIGFPVLPTWAAMDMLPANHPLLVGSFGLHGTRYGNFTVQNTDLVIALGSRLDTHLTGTPINTFAREAKKIIVDIDPNELNKYNKFGMDVDILIHSDVKDFLSLINNRAEINTGDITEWQERITEWKARYPICPPEYYQQKDVNPYVFVKALAKELPEGEVIFVDSGCGIAWMMQAFEFKPKQRLFSAFNNTPMGYSLPASIGASFALGKKQVTCITGDGGLQINMQELATILRHNLPIKIFLINNHGYSMIRQTQDQWFDSRYVASTVESGLAFPDFVKVAEAYGYRTLTITSNRELPEQIREVFSNEEPVFCNIEINPEHMVIPQVKFGRPIEDTEPLLDRQEFFRNMIVKPMEASLK